MSRLGWHKDPRDERDHIKGRVAEVPDIVDLSGIIPLVRDQGNLGSCTGFGIGSNLTGCAMQLGVYSEWFSPTWIYNGARLIEDTLPYDDGAYPRDCLEFIRKWGCLLEHFRPYQDTLDKTDPTTWGLNEEAGKWPIISYDRLVDGVDGIMAGLASGHLVSLGTPWYESWSETDSYGNLSEEYGWVSGGHEYLCYGYDKTKQVFMCQNSWGKEWGKSGRFTLPFSAIEQFKLDGGYDAHIVNVMWEEPVTPEPPAPVVGKTNWLLISIVAAVIVALVVIIFK